MPSATANPPQTTGGPASPASPTPSQASDTLPRMYIELWNSGNFDLLKSVLPSPAYRNSHGHRGSGDAQESHYRVAQLNARPEFQNPRHNRTGRQGSHAPYAFRVLPSDFFPNTAPPASSDPSGNIYAGGTRPPALRAYSLPECGPKVSPYEYLRPLASSCSEAIESPRLGLPKKPVRKRTKGVAITIKPLAR